MKTPDIPVTTAVRFLRANNIGFNPHFYAYEEHGGTGLAASLLKLPEHSVIKTIVMCTDTKKGMIVLMHGDREVSAKNLARIVGVKSVEPADARTAEKFTGYIFGGMSPFGTRNPLPVYVEHTIYDLEKIFINGGKRGFLVEISPRDLSALSPVTVSVAIQR